MTTSTPWPSPERPSAPSDEAPGWVPPASHEEPAADEPPAEERPADERPADESPSSHDAPHDEPLARRVAASEDDADLGSSAQPRPDREVSTQPTLGLDVEELEVLEVDVVGLEALAAAAEAAPDSAATVVVDAPAPVVVVDVGPALGPTGRAVQDFPEPPPLDRHGPARVVAVCNQKGGVGKTTSTINLGAALAGYGRRVLLLDFDPQGALSAGLGVNPNSLDVTVYDLLMTPREVAAVDVVINTDVPGLDLLPANIDLSAAEVALVNEVAREQTLARAIASLVPEYDYVLIDCQPSLGLLTVNALAASDGVIVPLECEYFALRGMKLLVETIEKVQDRINPRLQIDGILATMYDSRTVHRRQVLERVVEAFGDTVFHTVISTTVKFPETTVAGSPITEYAPSSAGAAAYRALAREVVARERSADRR